MLGAAVVLACLAAAAVGCNGESATSRADPNARELLAITTPPDASTTLLRRLDPDTLQPTGATLDLGEYHDAWAFSPDRRTLAVGTFARTGVRLIDHAGLRFIRDIPLPVAAVGVGWVTPRHAAVLLQRGGVVVVDAESGRVARRWRMSYRFPCERDRQATIARGVVFVVAARRGGAVRLVRIDDNARLRSVEVRRVRAPASRSACGAAAFAVDPSGRRALVAARRGPIAEVNLRSLAVKYRDSRPLRAALADRARCRQAGSACIGRRSAVWATADSVAIGGADWIPRRGRRPVESPAGVAVIDTRRWKAKRIDPAAGDVTITGQSTLLTFGGSRPGLRATGADGSAKWVALRGRKVHDALVAGSRVYVLGEPPASTHIFAAETGNLISSRAAGLGYLDVLDGRTDSGDPAASPGP